MKISQRLLVLLITLTMLLPGSFVQAFAEDKSTSAAPVVVSETADPEAEAAEETAEAPASDEEIAISAEENDKVSADNKDRSEADASVPKDSPDTQADVEKAADWEKTIPADLPSDIRKAVIAIAGSQLKYKESIKNYKEDGKGVRHAYSRYGEFAYDPYADEWDAEFVLFVLNYAKVMDTRAALKKDDKLADQGSGLMVPADTDTEKWAKALRKEGLFREADDEEAFDPECGDLVFLDYDSRTSAHCSGLQVGIVTGASDDGLEAILASTGTERNEVIKADCDTDDVAGYVSLRDIDPSAFEDEEASAEGEKADAEEKIAEKAEEAEGTDAEAKREDKRSAEDEGLSLVQTSIRAEISEPEENTLQKLFRRGDRSEDATVVIAGELPENARAIAVPADVEIEGQTVLAAYDITIYAKGADGKEVEWQPSEPLSVSISDSRLSAEDTAAGVGIYHMETEDADPELITETKATKNKVVFEAESFSIYAVSAPTYYIVYEFYLDKEFTQRFEFGLEGESSSKELKSNRIIVKNGDSLMLPAEPAGTEDFRGWYTASGEEVRPGPVSGITHTETVKLYARDGGTAFVVFHERQISESSGDKYFPVTSTSKVLLENGSGSIDISEIRPQIVYDDIEFVGWSTIDSFDDNERTAIDDQQVADSDTITSYVNGNLTITGTVDLYPVYKSVRYVRFYTGASGSGASYISSSSVAYGEELKTAKPTDPLDDIISPTWTGYEFLGWTREDKITEGGEINYNKLIIWDSDVAGEGGQLGPNDYFKNTEAGWNSQTEAVTEDITLYAVWKPVSSAQYHVAIWYESVNDEPGLAPENKEYVLSRVETKSGKPGTLLDYTTEAQAVGKGIVTPDGFVYSRGESATIEPDGSMTVNVYYDRQIYTVVVKPGAAYTGTVHGTGSETVYARTDDTSGELYGSRSGKAAEDLTPSDVFQLEYRFKGWRTGDTYHTGTVYNAWLVLLARTYSDPPGVNAGTVGYINPRYGINRGTAVAEYAWFEKGTNNEYTGDRYKEMEPYVAYYTGLYEQPIGFDYSLKYYYQPEQSQTIRLSKELNGNQYYLLKGSSNTGRYYDGSSFGDNDTLYISTEDNTQSIINNTGHYNSGGLAPNAYYAALITSNLRSEPSGNDFFTFPASSMIRTPELEPVELASFRFDDADKHYRVLDLSGSAGDVVLYRAKGSRFFVWSWSSDPRTVSLYKVNSLGADTPNLDGNTLTVFADSETSTYPATTSYYKVAAPDAAAAGFTPYANYTVFLNEYKSKVVSGQVSKFGGSAQTGTTVDVSSLRGSGAVLDGYAYTSYYNSSWKPAADTASTAGSSNDIKLLFEPVNVNVRFAYDRNENGTIEDNEIEGSITIPRGFSLSCFAETGDNPNATYIESYKDGAGITPPTGKVFEGWCYDMSGTQAFDPASPVTSDITLYADFDFAWYTANIDPRGGVISDGTDNTTWLLRQSGTYINNIGSIARGYIESDEGTYCYYYNDSEASDAYSAQGYVPRASGYVSVSDLSGWTQIDSTTYKDGAGTIYANVDTSVKYQDNYRLWKLTDWYDGSTDAAYDFSSPVTKDTYIYAVWKNLDTYKVRFDAGSGRHISSKSIDVLPSTGDSHVRTLNENFVNEAEVLIQYFTEPDDPSDNVWQFRGWRMKLSNEKYDDRLYHLGEIFTLDYRYADENGVITLEAVYDKLGTTSITYDANGGTGNLTDLEDPGIRSVDTANNRIYNIEINDKFDLSGGAGFTRTGYSQIGWSTDPDRRAEDFDPEGNLNEDFDLGEEVLADDLADNTLYAVWYCPDIEVYTYKNGDWQNGTRIAEGEYAPASMPSRTPDEVQAAAKAGLTPNDYDLSEYTFGYAKIEDDGTDKDVTNLRFTGGSWEYSSDNGTSWNALPVKPLRIYYFKTDVEMPVRYVKIEDDGYSYVSTGTADGNVKSTSPVEETVTASDPYTVKTLVGQGNGLVVNFDSKYSGYAYAIGSSEKDEGLYAISQSLMLRNDKDGFRYSTDGTNWTLWNIDTAPHIYVVYYPKGFVYVTVKALMSGDLADTTLDIPYSYEIRTTHWTKTITRSGNNNRASWSEGTLTPADEVSESDSFTLKSGQSRVFVLSNITDGNSSRTINANGTYDITAATQSITITQEWIDNYTLEITDVKDADGSDGAGTKNYATDPGTYTIRSIKSDPVSSYTTSGQNRTYSLTIPDIQDDTTATFNNIRKLVKVDIDKTLDDVLADEGKTFVFRSTASETASDGSTISCDLDDVQISLANGQTRKAALEGVPAGSRLLITETDAEAYDVTPAAAKTANAASDLANVLTRNNTVRFRVPAAIDPALSVATASFTNTRKKADVKILKIDEYGSELSGATFAPGSGSSPLPDGSAIAADGSSTILDGEMYYEGRYLLTETVVPDEFMPLNGAVNISISKTGVLTASAGEGDKVEVSGNIDDGYTVRITNVRKEIPAPTGFSNRYMPYILILAAGALLFLMIAASRRRKAEET